MQLTSRSLLRLKLIYWELLLIKWVLNDNSMADLRGKEKRCMYNSDQQNVLRVYLISLLDCFLPSKIRQELYKRSWLKFEVFSIGKGRMWNAKLRFKDLIKVVPFYSCSSKEPECIYFFFFFSKWQPTTAPLGAKQMSPEYKT